MTILMGMRGAGSAARKAMAATLMATTALGVSAVFAVPVLAQETRSYDIAPGQLADVLNQYARAASVELAYPASLTAGLSSSGLNGSYGAAEGLSHILAGTGITFRQTGPHGFTLERAPQSASGGNSIQLGPVRVQGVGSGRGSSTGTAIATIPADTHGTYTVPVSSSATKLNLSIKETPQVVHVMTRQRIEDQNLTQIADVMEQTPGVTVSQEGVPGAGRIDYYARGFPITNVMLDGVVTTGSGFRDFDLWSALDTAIYDRVELVQGSTGLTTGAGDPSAAVNFVRKRPTENPYAEAKLSYGSWNRARAEGDVSGPLLADGRVRGRLVAAYQRGDTWQDRVNSKTATLYGIVEADATDKLLLTTGLLWTRIHVDGATPYGMAPGGADPWIVSGESPLGPVFNTLTLGRSFNPATQWTFARVEMLNPFAKAEWRFADNWKINLFYNYSKIENERLYGQIGQTFYDPNNDLASYTYNHVKSRGYIHNLDASISGKFRALGRDQEIVAGVSGYWGGLSNPVYTALGIGQGPQTIAISQWNNGDQPLPTMGIPELLPGIPFPPNDLLTCNCGFNRMREKQLGFYLGTHLRPLKHLSLVLGGRYNRWERTSKNWSLDPNTLLMSGTISLVPNPDLSYDFKVKGKFTPYAGAIYDLTHNISVYASYTGIRRANANWSGASIPRDENGNFLPPIVGDTEEIGIKGGFFDNRLNVQLVGYRMKQKNLAQTPAVNAPGFPNPLGGWPDLATTAGPGVVAKGVDLSVTGQITPRLNISASYSYLKEAVFVDFGGQTDAEGRTGVKSKACVVQNTLITAWNSGISGRQFQCPAHQVKFFGTYKATDGLTVGGGLTWKSATMSYRDDLTDPSVVALAKALNRGSVAVVDLMARYNIDHHVSVSLNIDNLFDKKYLTSSDQLGGFWGAPRNVMVSLGFKY